MTDEELPKSVTWKYFLESIPPDELVFVSGLCQSAVKPYFTLDVPEISSFCSSDECNQHQLASGKCEPTAGEYGSQDKILVYTCNNCGRELRRIVARITVSSHTSTEIGYAFKYGEHPSFEPHVSKELLDLLGDDESLFRYGLRSESRGLGIGAFTYYRRVVEGRKDELFDAILEVARLNYMPPGQLAKLEKRKADFRFGRAVESFEDLIPDSLLIEGHNPLSLLHSTLSDGVHNFDDRECLRRANAIRTVLSELAERVDRILKRKDHVSSAIAAITANFSKPDPPIVETKSPKVTENSAATADESTA